jgi:broad specificity phosphatase PhoE
MSDVSLSPKGIRQAKAITRALRSDPPTRLYTSTLRRARDTAQIIARELGLRVVADERLNEIHFGKWEGVFFARLPAERGSEFWRWREGKLSKPPGGESVGSLARRVGQFLKEILKRHPEEKVAVVSHGGPIKMFLFKALKAQPCSIWSFAIDPASISLIEGNRNLLQIVWTNRIDHLNHKK